MPDQDWRRKSQAAEQDQGSSPPRLFAAVRPGFNRFSDAARQEAGTTSAQLKVAEQGWERDFTGGHGNVTLHLHLERRSDGTLSGRYRAEGGSPDGWPLLGALQTDGSFKLEGQKNDAVFTGRYTKANSLLIEQFGKGEIKLSNFEMRPAAVGAAAVKEGVQPAGEQKPSVSSKKLATTAPTPAESTAGNTPYRAWTETIHPKQKAKLPALGEKGFLEEAARVAQRLGVPRDMLLAVMAFESADWRRGTHGLDPQADNQMGYYGLTQIGQKALRQIMGSVDAINIKNKVNPRYPEQLKTLSALEQLQYIEIYFKQHGLPQAVERAKKEGRQVTLEELYMTNLGGSANKAYAPVWTNKEANLERYQNNKGLDADNDGNITPVEAADAVRLHWRETFGTNIDERSRHIERESVQVWNPRKQRMERDWRVKDHGTGIFSATMNLDPSQASPGTTASARPTPPTPAPPSLGATGHKAGPAWAHGFAGRGQGDVTFFFDLKRLEDGTLQGTYSANGGKAWSLQGSVLQDGRVLLEGLYNGARFEGRMTYQEHRVSLSGTFQNKSYRTALDATQMNSLAATKPVPAGEDASAALTEVPASGTPDALDTLLGLKGHLQHYSGDQIRAARKAIKSVDKEKQSQLYLLLQTKTAYHNQRNNESIGRAVDELNTPFGAKRERIGARIADVMCNLTSLAMALETLGIENPKPKEFPQFEDYLEDLRRQYVDKEMAKATTPAAKKAIARAYHREQRAGWGVVAQEMGAEIRTLADGGRQLKRDWWESTVLPELGSGNAVIMSITGHIVRVQGMNNKGLIVDDPFGRDILKTGVGWDNLKLNSITKEGSDAVYGENNLWPWEALEKHSTAWVAKLRLGDING